MVKDQIKFNQVVVINNMLTLNYDYLCHYELNALKIVQMLEAFASEYHNERLLPIPCRYNWDLTASCQHYSALK